MRFDHYHHLAGASLLEDILADLADHRSKLDRLQAAQEVLMANFDALRDEIARLITYIQTPRPAPVEDPAIQAEIDALAAQAKAAADAVTPPV